MELLRFGQLIKLLMEQLRRTMIADADMMSSRRRFGLFSQSTTLAIGDSQFPGKTAVKGDDGNTLTKPRNLLAGPNRSGVTKKAFIDAPSSVHVGDKYLDPEKIDHLYDKKTHGKSSLHQMNFHPNSWSKTLAASSYTHTDENPRQKKKPARDEVGRVVTKDKNITTNPISKIQKEFMKPNKYIIDPYERKDLIASQERKLSMEKRGEEIYRSMSHGSLVFGPIKEVFGVDAQAEALLEKKKVFTNSAPRKFVHDTNFKLARRGHGDSIGKYPQFIMPASKSQVLKTARRQKGDKDQWRPNGNKSLSRPTPSISYSSFNLRKCM